MQITKVRAVHVRIPLEKPYVFARGTMTAFDNVVVGIETNEDIVGWGESAPLHNSDTGDASTVAAWINEYGAALIGADPFDIELHVNAALEAAEGNVDCVAGIDVALWDLIGKALGQPIYRLIGGRCQDPIAVDYTISSEDPTEMVEYARKMCEQGFQGVVVKVTGGRFFATTGCIVIWSNPITWPRQRYPLRVSPLLRSYTPALCRTILANRH